MKIIEINLSDKQISELMQLHKKSGDYRSERALAVIYCSEGMKATEIAHILKRRINTICNWLNVFIEYGIDGLNRKHSEERPSLRNLKFTPKFIEYLEKYPFLKLFFLPPYFPEHNPVERIWKWSKAQVCALKSTEKGFSELLERFRKLHYARTYKRLANPFNVGIGIWNFIIENIYWLAYLLIVKDNQPILREDIEL